jgi:catechol 2,3-dioxygenase-like lactoylglutathione lyase family enzyme
MGARTRKLILVGAWCLVPGAWGSVPGAGAGQGALPAPSFHHLHLNSVNPDAAVDFYARAFPATSKTTFAGQPALQSANNVLVLFNKVATPPATQPTTAFWHFGWHVTDVRATLARYLKQNIPLLPLYTGLHPNLGSGTVFVSSDTYPGAGGVLGLTRAQVDEARAKGVKPNGGAGFAYLRGPDDALVEYQGNMPAERFNHVHMFHDQPFCAQVWYQTHLNVPVRPAAASAQAPARQAQRTEANCRVERGPDKTLPALDWDGMYRTPAVQTTVFGDVSLFFYMNQGSTPAGPTRGHLMDHIAVGVADLDAWIAKLKAGNVTFLEAQPYKIGDLRAVMIEGPSREAIEIVEVK